MSLSHPPSAYSITMSDILDRQPPGTPRPRFAPEQGLASLFIGAVMFITAPLTAAAGFALLGVSTKGKLLSASIDWLPYVGTTMPAFLMLVGVFLGILGLKRAKREGGSVALPATGLLLNLAAFFMWGVGAAFLYFVVHGW